MGGVGRRFFAVVKTGCSVSGNCCPHTQVVPTERSSAMSSATPLAEVFTESCLNQWWPASSLNRTAGTHHPQDRDLTRRHKDDGSKYTDGDRQMAVCAALLELEWLLFGPHLSLAQYAASSSLTSSVPKTRDDIFRIGFLLGIRLPFASLLPNSLDGSKAYVIALCHALLCIRQFHTLSVEVANLQANFHAFLRP